MAKDPAPHRADARRETSHETSRDTRSPRDTAHDEPRETSQDSLALLAAIVESSDDAIIGLTPEGAIESWNTGAERLFGYSRDEVRGRNVALLAPPESRDEIPRILGTVRTGARLEHFETRRVRKDGRTIDVSLTVSPIKNAAGAVVGLSKIARDITDARRAAAELLEAKREAEAASIAKDKFLAVLSHELRTPLAPVLVKVATLERTAGLSETVRADLAMIRRNVELEARLIDDLLDLTRIARGRLDLHRQTTDLRQSIHDALQASWGREAQAKQLQLVFELAAEDHVLHVDGARMTQVFWNLLDNAIKFTPTGGRVGIRSRAERRNGTRELVIEITDSGMGLPGEAIERIFEAFQQGSTDVARDFGGLGLGLAISRGIVELHGGRLTVTSEGPGRGSQFTVRLPWQPVAAAGDAAGGGAAASAGGAASAGSASHLGRAGSSSSSNASDPSNTLRPLPPELHVLLVEDHADTAEAMTALLEAMGLTVTVAGTVADARRAAEDAARRASEEASSARPLELVISDLDLPDGNGLSLMSELASRYQLRGIALSGFGMQDDMQRSRAAGFARHLVKPVNLDELEGAIRELAPEP